jgi:hypothetical protein
MEVESRPLRSQLFTLPTKFLYPFSYYTETENPKYATLTFSFLYSVCVCEHCTLYETAHSWHQQMYMSYVQLLSHIASVYFGVVNAILRKLYTKIQNLLKFNGL